MNIDEKQMLDNCYDFYGERIDEEKEFVPSESKAFEIWDRLDDISRNLADDECILRLGRFSAAPSVTVNEFRDIPPRKIRGREYEWIPPGASRFYSQSIYPMGWVKIRLEEA